MKAPLNINYQMLPHPINEGELREFLTALSQITVDYGVEFRSGAVVRVMRGSRYEAECATIRDYDIQRRLSNALGELNLLTINTGLAVFGSHMVPTKAMEGAYSVETDANGGAEFRGLKFEGDLL